MKRVATWFQMVASAIGIIAAILTGMWFLMGVRVEVVSREVREAVYEHQLRVDSTNASIFRELIIHQGKIEDLERHQHIHSSRGFK